MLYEQDQLLWTSLVKRYPSLGILNECCPEELSHRIRVETARLYREDRNVLTKTVHEIQPLWDTINDRWMLVLSEILEADWTSVPDRLIAYVGFNPVCPRNLVEHSFAVPCFLPSREIIRISAHETTHFLYFKKLRLLNPDVSEEEFNYPHREWLLSEILAPIVLNDPRSVQVIGASHINSYVCSASLSTRFAEMYRNSLTEGLDFGRFYQIASAFEIRYEDISPRFQAVLRPPLQRRTSCFNWKSIEL